MEVGKLIQRVQSGYSRGVESDDSRLSSRHIYNKLLTVRNKLLIQRINKNKSINDSSYSNLCCLEIIKAPISECKDFARLGCNIYRTKAKLPNFLNASYGHVIRFVTSLDGKLVFNEIPFNQAKYVAYSKYNSNRSSYYLRDNYLYWIIDPKVSYVTIQALLEDPADASQFCEDQNCFDIKLIDFSIDPDLIEDLIAISIDELVVFFSQNKNDISNNTLDD